KVILGPHSAHSPFLQGRARDCTAVSAQASSFIQRERAPDFRAFVDLEACDRQLSSRSTIRMQSARGERPPTAMQQFDDTIAGLGNGPPLVGDGRAGPPDRREVSARWLSGTFLTG